MRDFQTIQTISQRLSPPDASCPIEARHRAERRLFLSTAVGLGLLSGLALMAGCADSEEPPLLIATNRWIGYELLYLSQALKPGSNTSEPAGIRMIELLSNSDSVHALAAGTVDGAGLTLDEAIAAHAAGLDFKIALVFDFSDGADVLLARPELARLADLKGKRIGVEQTGVGALMLDAALKRAGLNTSEIEVVNMTVDQHLSAYTEHKVEALVTFEPVASQIEAQGGHRLFDSRAIPGSIVDVLAISTRALRDKPKAARRLVADYFQALSYFHRHPLEASQRMAPRLGLTPAAVERGYRDLVLPDLADNRHLLGGTPVPLETLASKLASLMQREKLIAKPCDVTGFVIDSLLPGDQS